MGLAWLQDVVFGVLLGVVLISLLVRQIHLRWRVDDLEKWAKQRDQELATPSGHQNHHQDHEEQQPVLR